MNRFTAPAAPSAGFCRSARARQGFARCARRGRGLDPPASLPSGSAITGATDIMWPEKSYQVQGPPGFHVAVNDSPLRACSSGS